MGEKPDDVTMTITLPAAQAAEIQDTAEDLGLTVEDYLARLAAGEDLFKPDPDGDPEGYAGLAITDAIASLEWALTALEQPSGLRLDLQDLRTTITRVITKLRQEDDQLGECAVVIMHEEPLAISFGVRPGPHHSRRTPCSARPNSPARAHPSPSRTGKPSPKPRTRHRPPATPAHNAPTRGAARSKFTAPAVHAPTPAGPT